MIEESFLRPILQDIVGSGTNLIFGNEIKEHLELTTSNHTSIVISSLDHLIDLPKRIRRDLHEGKLISNSQHSSLESSIRVLLSCTLDLLTTERGKDKALLWREELYSRIRQIIASEGFYGILNGGNSLVQIKEKDQKERFEIIEELIFSFQNYEVVIGTRTIQYGDSALLFEYWSPAKDYISLYHSLKNLHENVKFEKFERNLHLFVWSDSPLKNFQPSFVSSIFSDYIYGKQRNHKSEAAVILLLSTASLSDPQQESQLNKKQYLALQRAHSGGVLYLAPGSSEDIFKNEIMRISRPNSVFKVMELKWEGQFSQYSEGGKTQYIKDVHNKLMQLGLFDLRIGKGLSTTVHEAGHDLVEQSAFAVISRCWTGTWAESLEIDGEQVI